MKKTKHLWIGILACGLLALSGTALAADVTLSNYNSFYVLDASDGTVDGVYNVIGDLTLDPTASINCNDNATDQPPGPVAGNASACNITINVLGNLTMQAGSAIYAENRASGGDGGNIVITALKNVTLEGGVPTGALISSRKISGAGDTGIGGNITIHAGKLPCEDTPDTGDVIVRVGAQILADSPGNPGDIEILAGRFITIQGKVSSANGTSVGRGGRITMIACCDLFIGLTGIVQSIGHDPGADLVHLEACNVTILGLVQSTGAGHNDAGAIGNNACNDANHVAPAGKKFRGCVEIWSGNTILIDASVINNGQINADMAFGGGSEGMGWIDIYANGNITVKGNNGLPFAVHANTGVGGAIAGDIVVKSKFGNVTASDLAFQAANNANGGNGGRITLGSQLAMALTTATLDAHGDYVPTIAKGGKIVLQASAAGSINWLSGTGDVRPTGSTVPAANRGTITVSDCGNTTLGATFPFSAGAQSNPINALCVPVVVPEPANSTLVARLNCLTQDCTQERELPPPFCEKAPVRAVLDPVNGDFPGNQGPDVLVRVDLGESIQAALDAAKVPGFDAAHNNDGYIIIAVSAHADHSLGGDTNQSALIDGTYEFPFALFGCSVTMHSAGAVGHITAGATAPDNPPLSGLNIFIMDLHASDGSTGWLIEGNGRSVRNTYGKNNGTGISINGNNNLMHNGQGSNNSGVGLLIQGNGNYVTDTDVFGNGSHGLQVVGNTNQIWKVDAGDKGKGNGGDGVNSSGTGNRFEGIDAFANKGWGFVLGGTGAIITSNTAGDKGDKANGKGGFLLSGGGSLTSNTAIGNLGAPALGDGFRFLTGGFNVKSNTSGGTGSGTPNTGCQFSFGGNSETNGGSNKSKGVTLAGLLTGCR